MLPPDVLPRKLEETGPGERAGPSLSALARWAPGLPASRSPASSRPGGPGAAPPGHGSYCPQRRHGCLEASSGRDSPLTVISLIFRVFSLIHFSLRTFSVALISSLSFLISCRQENRWLTQAVGSGKTPNDTRPGHPRASGVRAPDASGTLRRAFVSFASPGTSAPRPAPGAALFWAAERDVLPQARGARSAAATGQQGGKAPPSSHQLVLVLHLGLPLPVPLVPLLQLGQHGLALLAQGLLVFDQL